MKLKLKYGSEADIPEGFAALYTEKDGEWHLTGVEGMKTSADTDKLSKSLREERAAHKATKDKLAKLGGEDVDMDELVEKLDDYDDMKARLDAGEGGKVDEDKLEQMVEARVNRKLKPVERERDQLKSKNGELEAENSTLKGTISTGTIEGELRKLAGGEKVVDTALDDILFIGANLFEVAEDGAIVGKAGVRGIEEGTTPDVWMADMKEKRPHWWPASEGGGAGGGKGDGNGVANPWTASGWDIDAQAALVRTDRAKAQRLAQAAGSSIGSVNPPKAA